MDIQSAIGAKIHQHFTPQFVEVSNVSHQHHVPKDAVTHLQVVIVSDVFVDKSLINRQRAVHEVLAAEIAQLHACGLRLYTPQEWETTTNEPAPPCRGGFKHDHDE